MMKINLNNRKEILEFHYKNITNPDGKEWSLQNYFNKEIDKKHGKDITKFYKFLKKKVLRKKNSDFNKSILTADPKTLEKFKKKIEKKFGSTMDSKITRNGKKITVRKDLERVFFYNNYTKWKAYELAKKIGNNVCPYCNRSYTFTHYSNSKGKFYTRFEYDHFISHTKHPYFGLSFFNLVPSCHICNSNLKKEKQFRLKKHFHPYHEGFGDNFKFTININQVGFINGKGNSYKIEFRKNSNSNWKDKKVKSAKRNIKVFQLKKLYNLHKDYVDEIIAKKYIYTEDQIDQLFSQYEGTLFNSKDEVKRIIYGNYLNIEDQNKRVLSKLTSDILTDLENKDIIT